MICIIGCYIQQHLLQRGKLTMSYSEYFECGVVSYCRKVFGKEYANMWIDVIKADDTYFDNVWNFLSTLR